MLQFRDGSVESALIKDCREFSVVDYQQIELNERYGTAIKSKTARMLLRYLGLTEYVLRFKIDTIDEFGNTLMNYDCAEFNIDKHKILAGCLPDNHYGVQISIASKNDIWVDEKNKLHMSIARGKLVIYTDTVQTVEFTQPEICECSKNFINRMFGIENYMSFAKVLTYKSNSVTFEMSCSNCKKTKQATTTIAMELLHVDDLVLAAENPQE